MSSAVNELTEASFDEQVRTSPLPVLVEFGAEWCPPCKVMAPVLDSVADEYADRLRVLTIDTDTHPELARRYDLMSVPTMLVFAEGEPRLRLVGARSRSQLLGELAGFLGAGDCPLS
ncbi:MAG TPA: thioredoxin domain-containing protein [Acidimicrobiales bacterium]|jgi:thioredoxin 1|nr:thioredoxin domain-containing protein [Acidimicrobiales bacterium]